ELAETNARAAEEREREAAANFRLAESAVERYFTRVSESPELRAHGLEQLRKQLLGEARTFYQEFVAKRGGDPRLRGELADAYYGLGLITAEVESRARAVPLFAKALDIARELAREHPGRPEHRYQIGTCLCELGNLAQLTGRLGEARRLREDSLDVFKK